MEPIYVTGHRNPDTDSIVSAMAYAALRNALGDREYVAARLGHISDETRLVLNRFGFAPPLLIKTMRTQVRDLEYDTPPALNAAVTVSYAWSMLQSDEQIPALPVTNDDGSLFGMVSAAEIAAHDMQNMDDPALDRVPLFNLLGVLDGKLLNDFGDLVDEISGEIIIALPQMEGELPFRSAASVVLCGNQPELIRSALEQNVNCLILCQAEIREELRHLPTKTCIIATPLDAARAARVLHHAIPVSRICRQKGPISFHLEDYLDDVQEIVLKTRHRSYPILDENNRVVGTLSRHHLLRPRRKRLVLVDHNESSQSVAGLAQAEILAIIDHHRLADIQTVHPIWFRNEPVGSTATIIAGMFQEHGLVPSRPMAGLIASAILTDTIMFKSPTCTEKDRRLAERMARIANISLDELGKEIFSQSTAEDRDAHTLFRADYKDFHIADHNFGVSQITCVDSHRMLERKDEFFRIMRSTREKEHYSMVLLMLTDILLGGSYLLFDGDPEIIRHAFGVEPKNNICFLPHVLSRKKQVIPELAALWG